MSTPKQETFEEALARLEAIVREIEEGRIGLEESIGRFEEGMQLIQRCRGILQQAELKIQSLHESADGTLQPGPMAAEAVNGNDREVPF